MCRRCTAGGASCSARRRWRSSTASCRSPSSTARWWRSSAGELAAFACSARRRRAASSRSLHRHQGLRQLLVQALLLLFGELVRVEDDDELLQRSAEAERHLAIVLLKHRSPGVLSDVEGLVER